MEVPLFITAAPITFPDALLAAEEVIRLGLLIFPCPALLSSPCIFPGQLYRALLLMKCGEELLQVPARSLLLPQVLQGYHIATPA